MRNLFFVEDFRRQIHIPALTEAHLMKNWVAFLLLNACKWMLHNCYFCYTLESAAIEEEIEFFRAKLGEHKTLSELQLFGKRSDDHLHLSEGASARSSSCILRQLEDNEFPITLELTNRRELVT